MSDFLKRPAGIILEPSPEALAEAKGKQEILSLVVRTKDALDHVLKSYQLSRVLRIGAWVYWVWRFVGNCQQQPRNRPTGPITTEEIELQEFWWIKKAQKTAQYNDQHFLECRGRIMKEYPIYLSDEQPFTMKVVFQAHLSSLHGGVRLTMAKVRERYWVPRLRRLVKKLRGDCYGYKSFRARAYRVPPHGNLPETRPSHPLYFLVCVK